MEKNISTVLKKSESFLGFPRGLYLIKLLQYPFQRESQVSVGPDTVGLVTSEDIGTESGGLKNLKLTFICLNSPSFICLLSTSHSGYLKSIDRVKNKLSR